MALSATIFKAELQVADLDRHHYATYPLTLARHPSETDQRMMVRLLAFALHADPALSFGRGVSNDDEPALWLRDLTGDIRLWIDLGLPDPDRLRKACARANEVIVYSYNGNKTTMWWRQHRERLLQQDKLRVIEIPADQATALTVLVQRSMQLHCTLQDGEVAMGDSSHSIELHPTELS